MITEAERRFAVRFQGRGAAGGLWRRLNRMHDWLDDTCGANGWEITSAGMRGIINDAIAVYFREPALAAAFTARCIPAALLPSSSNPISGGRASTERDSYC